MAKPAVPSYTELVYAVLRAADEPLTVDEILAAVNARRTITTKNPKATIRNILGTNWLLVNNGHRRYGYLPRVINGSVLRLPLVSDDIANESLFYPHEVRDALWPAFYESQSRRDLRPVQLTLPTGDVATLPMDYLAAAGAVGSPRLPDALRQYLIDQKASAGDALVIRVIDGEAGLAEAVFAPHRDRDEPAIALRNRALGDAVEEFLRKDSTRDRMIWEITLRLLATGFYQDGLPPDSFDTVMTADERIVEAGMETWALADAMTPERWQLVEVRREMEHGLFDPRLDPSYEDAEPLAMGQLTEQMMADITALLDEHEFATVEEANAFLQGLQLGGGLPPHRALTALDQAQDLIYAAWESPSTRERVRLAHQALKISPDCADAYVLLADETARDAAQAAELYAQGVAAGERALGTEAFNADVGYFWGILETRPYMRAKAGLADALWVLGGKVEAIGQWWDMLRLNPGDNQGIRYLLLNQLLELGDDADALNLLNQYPEEVTAVWKYGRTLHAFRTSGPSKRTKKLLADSRRWNPYVPAYLLGGGTRTSRPTFSEPGFYRANYRRRSVSATIPRRCTAPRPNCSPGATPPGRLNGSQARLSRRT